MMFFVHHSSLFCSINQQMTYEGSIYVAHNLRIYIYIYIFTNDLYLQPPRDLYIYYICCICTSSTRICFWHLLEIAWLGMPPHGARQRQHNRTYSSTTASGISPIGSESCTWVLNGWFSVGAWNFIHHSLGFFQTAAFLEDVGIDVVLEKVHLEIFREPSHSFNMLIHSKLSGVGISPAALGLGYPMVFKSDQVHPSVIFQRCVGYLLCLERLG